MRRSEVLVESAAWSVSFGWTALGANGRSRYPAARVVLENLSAEPITIELAAAGARHLRLVLSTFRGETVSSLR